jgi:sugar lactone lactonase YvrE
VKGVAVLAAVVAAACAAAPPVSLEKKPESLVAGRTWTAMLRTRADGVPTLGAQLDTRTVSARGRRVGKRLYRARLRFPSAGTWTLSAALGRRRVGLGSIEVKPAPHLLDQPAQALALGDGSLLVAERGDKNRVLRVDPATGRFSVFATGVRQPFGLARSADGSILISSDAGLFRVPASGGRATKTADVPTSPILPAPDGEIFYGHLSELGRIPPGARTGQRLPVEVDAPHGLAFAADGDLVVSDTGNDRLLRVDLPSTHVSVVAAGLRTPVGMIAESGSAFLVLEFDAGALTRVDESGRTTTVATGFDKPYALARAPDGTVYVVQVGELFPPTGRIRRVAPDGTVSTVTLIRP